MSSGFKGASLSAIMIQMLLVAVAAGLFLESNQQLVEVSGSEKEDAEGGGDVSDSLLLLPLKPGLPCYYPTNIQCWTDWFDRDDPTGTGDWETLSDFRSKNPGRICPKPLAIEAMTLCGVSASAAGDVIFKNDVTTGFICRNQDQQGKMCHDYRVRFSCHPPFCGGVCWTKWYNRDRPSGTGDWELLSFLRTANPGEICDNPLYIEAVTTDTMTPAVDTGDVFFHYNPTHGLVCKNEDQKAAQCRDYKVRFGCPCSG